MRARTRRTSRRSSSTLDTTQSPNLISLGNPNLKAEHSNNYDLLFEQYLNPVGIIQAGFFYKQLGDPIVNGQFAESPSLFASQVRELALRSGFADTEHRQRARAGVLKSAIPSA